ncbi:DDE_3 domain-containing protein [Trichonephila clavipes]|nr:DDE_3 domain-containing protein [Trichonephila clavipes]
MINGRTRLHVVANGTMTGQRYIDEVLLPHVRLFRGAVARSPDLNSIENVWDALGRQVAGRNYPPTNKNTLIRALTEEWDKLPLQLLDNVVQIEGFESKGTTQCFQCNQFNHKADNCHLTPRYLKCGDTHQTRECQIKGVDSFSALIARHTATWPTTPNAPFSPSPAKAPQLKLTTPTLLIVSSNGSASSLLPERFIIPDRSRRQARYAAPTSR